MDRLPPGGDLKQVPGNDWKGGACVARALDCQETLRKMNELLDIWWKVTEAEQDIRHTPLTSPPNRRHDRQTDGRTHRHTGERENSLGLGR